MAGVRVTDPSGGSLKVSNNLQFSDASKNGR